MYTYVFDLTQKSKGDVQVALVFPRLLLEEEKKNLSGVIIEAENETQARQLLMEYVNEVLVIPK